MNKLASMVSFVEMVLAANDENVLINYNPNLSLEFVLLVSAAKYVSKMLVWCP